MNSNKSEKPFGTSPKTKNKRPWSVINGVALYQYGDGGEMIVINGGTQRRLVILGTMVVVYASIRSPFE